MDFLDYREKLGIGFCDNEKYKFFLVKIFSILGEIALDTRFCGINASEYREFCRITGMEVDYKLLSEFIGPAGYRHWLSILRRVCEDPREFFAYYISLVNIVPEDREPDESGRFFERKGLIKLLTAMLAESHIGYNLINADGEYFVFPKGAVELDSALVSQPLAWLNQYPKAHTAFVKALREYADATTEYSSDIADKFRKALETFFQEFFKNDKALESNKSIYGNYLSKAGVPKEIASNFETLLQTYCSFMNGYAKHHDKTELNVLEYLMYQTGNIIRLLITLKQAEPTPDN